MITHDLPVAPEAKLERLRELAADIAKAPGNPIEYVHVHHESRLIL